VSRRASEESSTSGGASSDRPVGGSPRRKTASRTMSEFSKAVSDELAKRAGSGQPAGPKIKSVTAEARSAKMDE
jgi:hypothetical protein